MTVVGFHGGEVRVLEASLRGGRVVVDRWGSAPASAEDLRGCEAARACSEAGIKTRAVVLCLPAQAVVLKRVQLPPAAPEQIPQLVQFEAQRHLPLPIEQLATGYELMGESTADGTEVLLAITRRDELARLAASLESAGLQVEGCGIDALALAGECVQRGGPTENGHARLLVSADSEGVHAQVLHGGRLLFNRYLAFAGSDWSTDLRRSLTSYALDQPARPIGEVVILGDADETALARITHLPVRHLVRESPNAAGNPPPKEFAALAGVARQWLGAGELPLVLEPEAWRSEVRKSGRSTALLAVAATVAVVGVVVTLQFEQQEKRRADAESARKLTRLLDADKKQLTRLRQSREELAERLRQTGGDPASVGAAAASRGGTPLELLRQVSTRIPSGVWLTEVIYRQGQPLQLIGTSRQGPYVTTFIRSLETLPSCRRVELGFLRSATVEETPVTHFRLDCTLAGRSRSDAKLTGSTSP